MKISDHDKALLFLYACSGSIEGPDKQVSILAKLCDWTEGRAKAALEETVERGHSNRSDL